MSNQFSMQDRNVKVASVNPRAEKHGEDNVLAADIKIQANCASTVLDHFEPKLRSLLFRKPAVGEQQALPVDGNEGMTGIRCPELGELSWDAELTGYTMKITRGMGLAEPLLIDGVDLKKFRFSPLEGGTVAISFNVVCHPDTEQMGQLCDLIQEEVELTLIAPKAAAQKKAA